jgi:hypothetical protein
MKKILIIADGILAKHFLQRVIENLSSENSYDVITYKNKTIPDKKPENFKFYDFDPTSFEKLYPVLANDYYQIMILVSKKIDAIGTYKNIRTLNKEVQIIMLDRWSLNLDDKRLQSLDSKNILSSRFSDYLPDIPVIAQNVGLGIGEIMEIRVPVGSSFVYRHIASIAQRKWKIAGVYRGNKLLLPLPTLMIHPNDTIYVTPNNMKSLNTGIKEVTPSLSLLGAIFSPIATINYLLK